MFHIRRIYLAFSIVLLSITSFATQAVTAQLFAKPEAYIGSCPTRIQFKGIIHSDTKGKVQYRFIRSDDANTPVKTIIFSQPGKLNVNSSWTLGSPDLPTYEGWQALEITYPFHSVSNKARFSIRCHRGK